MIRVVLQCVGGSLSCGDYVPESTILTVKEHILEERKIPIRCQALFSGSDVVSDSTPLASLVSEDSAFVALTCIFSYGKVLDTLANGTEADKSEALADLALLGPRRVCAARAVSALLLLTNDPSSWVRFHAEAILGSFSDELEGDREVVSVIIDMMNHDNVTVACWAIDALPLFAEQGDQLALRAVQVQVGSTRVCKVYRAVDALGSLATPEDTDAVTALTNLVRHRAEIVRLAAEKSLRNLANLPGASQAADALGAEGMQLNP